jgi:cytochrome P450
LARLPWYMRMLAFESKRKLNEATLIIKKQCDELRRAFYEKNGETQAEIDKRAMISEILRMEQEGEFTERQVASEMAVLIIAGHETTATTITWALWFLARNPDVQARVQVCARACVSVCVYVCVKHVSNKAEVDSVMAREDVRTSDGVNNSILQHLPLVKGAMFEALRLRPVAFATAREASVAFSFPNTDVVLPAGSLALVSFYSMGHSAAIWGDDVEAFRPERHADAEADKRHPFAFLSFGGGPRVCLGKRFAVQEGQLMLLRVLKVA